MKQSVKVDKIFTEKFLLVYSSKGSKSRKEII